jgi:flagellar basal body rod protein FlgC
MDSGYYAAMTGLVARTQALDTAASNLANAQTPGYRAEREFFRSVLLGPDASDSQLGHVVNNFGLLGGDRLTWARARSRRPAILSIWPSKAKDSFRYKPPTDSALPATAAFTARNPANW